MIDAQRVKTVPQKPGVYLFKDESGKVLYVGKAASLRSRVRSYLNPSGQTFRTQTMTTLASDVEWVVTDSEIEAIILESNLIKQYRPRFNIRLRDDKQFPYICVTIQEPFPRIFRVRRTRKDGSRYFGPYANSGSLNQTLSLLKKLFPYRSCDIAIPDDAVSPEPVLDRPCLEYFIKRCTAPCVRYVSKSEYRETIDQVLLFLEGKHDQVLTSLRERMREYAKDLNFEGAAHVRDQIQAVERSIEKQKITAVGGGEYDVVGVAVGDRDASAQVFQIRGGKVVDQRHFMLDNPEGQGSDEDVLGAFVKQFYERATHIPRRILLPRSLSDAPAVEDWLRNLRGGPVSLSVPERGEKRKLVDMATANARDTLEQSKQRWLSDQEKTSIALAELEASLKLPHRPDRIECFDISTIQGASTVASMVVFEDGRPANNQYRRFKITSPDGPDDFASMREVIRRRFRRAVDSNGSSDHQTADGWRKRPDLVVIDGGKGQLNAALEALNEVGSTGVPVVSLAKRQEEVFIPLRPRSLLLPRESQSLYLLQRIRDEAHRFAITYHRQVRTRRAQVSALDGFRGIGPVKRRALIRAFGSLRGVRQASVEEIAAVPGINPTMAASLKQYLAE